MKRILITVGIIAFILGGVIGGVIGWECAQPMVDYQIKRQFVYFDIFSVPDDTWVNSASLKITKGKYGSETPSIIITWTKDGKTITSIIFYDIDKASTKGLESLPDTHWYFRWGYQDD